FLCFIGDERERVKEGGRLALLYSNAGSMWASRPQSYRGQWLAATHQGRARRAELIDAPSASDRGSDTVLRHSAALFLIRMPYTIQCLKLVKY
ncbi:MAG: hypothetical protein P8R37_03925, partial [Opitutae bacterium]|nr:hypothetical protein [Opitutae bacterium]